MIWTPTLTCRPTLASLGAGISTPRSRARAARETGALIDAGVTRIATLLGFNWHALPPTPEGVASAFADRLFELTFLEDFSDLPDVRSCAALVCCFMLCWCLACHSCTSAPDSCCLSPM